MKRLFPLAVLSAALAATAAHAAPEDAANAQTQDSVTSFSSQIKEQQSLQTVIPPVERLQKQGLPNLARVERNIYRGGRPQLDRGGMESLRALGIKTIVNLQGGDLISPKMSRFPGWSLIVRAKEPGEEPENIAQEISAARTDAILDVNIPLSSLDPVTDAEAAELDRVLTMIAASSPDNPIYIHCEHGKDRTGLVLGLYRMRYDG